MSVDTLIDEVISREGGYVDHPADRGGPTMFGITEAVARANGYDGPMRNLPRATAGCTGHGHAMIRSLAGPHGSPRNFLTRV
jgi:hypothetical protein